MRISDWSSDVCSSDLLAGTGRVASLPAPGTRGWRPGALGDCDAFSPDPAGSTSARGRHDRARTGRLLALCTARPAAGLALHRCARSTLLPSSYGPGQIGRAHV